MYEMSQRHPVWVAENRVKPCNSVLFRNNCSYRVKRRCLIGGSRFWLGKDVGNSRGWRRRRGQGRRRRGRGEAQLSRDGKGKDRGRKGKVPIRKGEDGWFSLC
jgi:hypothetical protein